MDVEYVKPQLEEIQPEASSSNEPKDEDLSEFSKYIDDIMKLSNSDLSDE